MREYRLPWHHPQHSVLGYEGEQTPGITKTIIFPQVYDQPEWYTDLLDYINLFFTFFFVGEFMLKFGAFRFKNYFSDPWNGFDFFIVVGSLIDLGFAQLAPDSEVNHQSLGRNKKQVLRLFPKL